MKKIISYILIFFLLVQIPFTNFGCRAAFPTDVNDLSKYVDENVHILIKLMDDRSIETYKKDMLYIVDSSEIFYGIGDKYNYGDKTQSNFEDIFYDYDVDSTKIIKNNSKSYRIFWMKDNTRLSIETRNLNSIKPDSGKNCWAVKEYSGGSVKSDKLIRIYEEDIIEIQEFNTTWIGYAFVGLSAVGFIDLSIALANSKSGLSGCRQKYLI